MAALSGLTWLAYKHPEGFEKIFIWIQALGVFAMAVCMATFMGYTTGFSQACMDTLQINPQTVVKLPKQWQMPMWVWISYPAFNLYLFFLKALPHIIKKEEPSKPRKTRGGGAPAPSGGQVP